MTTKNEELERIKKEYLYLGILKNLSDRVQLAKESNLVQLSNHMPILDSEIEALSYYYSKIVNPSEKIQKAMHEIRTDKFTSYIQITTLMNAIIILLDSED